ncbi:MAG: hypothetical protein ACODAQ_11720 [Phycisphaeraceae bacterium]
MAHTLVLLALLAALPPLSEAQREQLADTTDRTAAVDEGALYALLPNVLEWRADDEMAAMVNVNYQALLDEPAAYRGEVILLEGSFYGRSDRFALNRAGPWGEAVTMWVLALDDRLERMAVVFLVDPEGQWHTTPPRRGKRVQVPARFFKVWQQADNRGQATDYLVFVGRFPQVGAASGAGGAAGLGMAQLAQMVLLVVVFAGALIWILHRSRGISFRPRPLPRQEAPVEPPASPTIEEDEPLDEAALPDDPAAALDELSRRHGEDEQPDR